jgi:hypothetical protein
VLSMSGLTTAQQAIFNQAADRWEEIITGDLPNATYNGQAVDDLLIHASSVAIDGAGGILGQAGPDRFRSGTLLPYHGVMQFDSADLAQLQANGGLYYVVLHEIGHILGIGTIWQSRGLLAGAGTNNPRFTGSNAVAAYNSIFGTNASAVPVESGGGAGTRDSHWRESTFNNELMTGYLNSGTNPMSRITVGSLADLGYTVDMNAADDYTPPGGGGGGNSSGGGDEGGGGDGDSDGGRRFRGGSYPGCACPVCNVVFGGGSAATEAYLPVAGPAVATTSLASPSEDAGAVVAASDDAPELPSPLPAALAVTDAGTGLLALFTPIAVDPVPDPFADSPTDVG